MKQILFIAAFCCLSATASFAQNTVQVINDLSCDIVVDVKPLDVGCGPVGTTTFHQGIPANDFYIFTVTPTVNEYEVTVTVDPAGANVTLSAIYTAANCGADNTSNGSACMGSPVNVSTAPGSGMIDWDVTVN